MSNQASKSTLESSGVSYRDWAPIAAFIAIEFTALTFLSRVEHPQTTTLFATYGPAFAAYVALLTIARNTKAPLPLSPWVWFAAALLIRIPWLMADVSLSDDVWRYLHDGRAQLAGINPFLYPPSAPEAAAYAGPAHSLINNPDLPTIYPPFAQLAFRLAATFGTTLLSWKLVLLIFDLGIGATLLPLLRRRRLPTALVAAYLLHPLPIIEFAGNGHVDAIAICTLMMAFVFIEGRVALSGAALAASVASKYLALPLAPFFLRHLGLTKRWTFVAAAGIAVMVFYAPFTNPLPIGSLDVFAQTFEFNGPLAEGLGSLVTREGARWFIGAALMSLLAWMWLQRVGIVDAGFVWIAAVLLLSPIVHPWYLTWLVPFLACRRDQWVLVWTGTVIAAYAVLPAWWSSGIWDLPTWALVLEYVPVYVLMAVAALGAYRQRGANHTNTIR